MRDKTVAESHTIMTEMIMPNDTNPLDNLMGGNLMRWMDIAGGICAAKHCESNVVTASVDNVSFQKPIRLGCVITIKASVTRAFNTSVEVYLEVHVAKITGADPMKSNHAYMTFVALDKESLSPIKIPKVIPLSEEEQKHYEGAIRRRQIRLIQAGRLKPQDATELKNLFIEE